MSSFYSNNAIVLLMQLRLSIYMLNANIYIAGNCIFILPWWKTSNIKKISIKEYRKFAEDTKYKKKITTENRGGKQPFAEIKSFIFQSHMHCECIHYVYTQKLWEKNNHQTWIWYTKQCYLEFDTNFNENKMDNHTLTKDSFYN